MVVTQQFRTIASPHHALRPLPADTSVGTLALPSMASRGRPRFQLPAFRFSWVRRELHVPYWIIAVSLVSMLAGSVSLATVLQPAHQARPAALPIAAPGQLTGAAAQGSGDVAQQSEDLQAALSAVSADLQRAQRTNAELRNEAKRNADSLASAQDQLSLSQQAQQGQLQDGQAQANAQLQDMQARYDTLSQAVQDQLSALEQKAAAAEQLANKLRSENGS